MTPEGFKVQPAQGGPMLILHGANAVDKAAKHHGTVTKLFSLDQVADRIEFLIAQGVNPKRISSIAYGKERPAALCDAEQCWTQNRRAVTVITGGAS